MVMRATQAKGPSTSLGGGGGTYPPTAPAITPAWFAFTFDHEDFQDASLARNIEAYSLGIAAVLHGLILRPTIAFAGTGITAYTLSVGLAGDLERYTSQFDMMAAVSNTNFLNSGPVMEARNMGAVTSIRLSAVSEGANLDQSTAGALTLYLLLSALP